MTFRTTGPTKIFVAVGWHNDNATSSYPIDSVEVHDLNTGQQCQVPTANFPDAMDGAFGVMSFDKPTICGGYTRSGLRSGCDTYDDADDNWTQEAFDIGDPRCCGAAVKIRNDAWLLLGGQGDSLQDKNYDTIKLFDQGVMLPGSPTLLPEPMGQFSVTMLNSTHLFVRK